MNNPAAVLPHLKQRFQSNRIVFWHDPESQHSEDLDALDLPGVTKIRVANNEYGIKHRLLHTEPAEKFLIFRSGKVPAGIENWLLDLELAYGVFTADRSSLIAQDLGLAIDGMSEVVQSHEKFFNSIKRVETLKALVNPEDNSTQIRAKMTAVILRLKDSHTMLEITRTLIVENAKGATDKYEALVGYGLDAFYWQSVTSHYGYETSTPSIDDFVLWIFRKAMRRFKSEDSNGFQNIRLDFASLRNDRHSQKELAILAKRAALDLDYASTIEDTNFRDLIDFDLFQETDQKIIIDLTKAVTEHTVTAREVADVIRVRQTSFWIDEYKRLYTAISSAAELLALVSSVDLSVPTFDEGLKRYCSDWFRIDQLYRKFIYAFRTSEGPHPLDPLRDEVEKRYSNEYVYELGKAWQQRVDEAETWTSSALRSQRTFYRDYVEHLVREDKKAVVIISDAMRYEVGEELGLRIRQEDRFDASVDAVLGVLPSYTQLGMAALLPHTNLKYSPDANVVLADGQPTNGTANRKKVLEGVGGTAIQAEDFKALNAEERRELFKANSVLYIYHNVIDSTGDKQGTERSVFEAVEQTFLELIDLVKKAASANATNMFVTADHGFLFQDESLPEQFFLSTNPEGDDIKVTNKRFVLGHGLKNDDAFTTFSSAQLELDGDLEIQIPKSIHRLKRPGGGTRFVHGGATLQEVVVPVVSINKKRRSDTRPVNVTVLPESDKITTNQIVVRLFQTEPVSEKVQPLTVRAGLYVGETLISNHIEFVFDEESDDIRDRYKNADMLLGQDSNDYNNRAVEFRLEEKIPNTNYWRTYTKVMYTLKRSFVSDFDI